MRQLAFVCCCLGVGWPGFVRADEADDLMARARKAQLGSVDLREVAAVLKFKGTVLVVGESIPFDGELIARPGEGDRLKIAFHFSETVIHFLFHGDKREILEGDIGEITPSQYLHIVRTSQSFRTTLVTALLSGWGDKVELLGESKLDGRTVLGMHRTLTGRAERTYFLDKEAGYLRKLVVPKQPSESVPFEVVFAGHSSKSADETVLERANVRVDAGTIAALLKKQSPDAPTRAKLKTLIAQLGADDFAAREQATKDAVALGMPALPSLEQAARSDDLEIARRAADAITQIKELNSRATAQAAVRMLARLKSANATGVLLNYLSGADEETAAEVRAALVVLARRDGQVDPLLEKTLTDKDAVKRATAEAVLGKDGGAYLKMAGRRLYLDGGKFPAKASYFVTGQLSAELDFLDVQFFNRLEDQEVNKR